MKLRKPWALLALVAAIGAIEYGGRISAKSGAADAVIDCMRADKHVMPGADCEAMKATFESKYGHSVDYPE